MLRQSTLPSMAGVVITLVDVLRVVQPLRQEDVVGHRIMAAARTLMESRGTKRQIALRGPLSMLWQVSYSTGPVARKTFKMRLMDEVAQELTAKVVETARTWVAAVNDVGDVLRIMQPVRRYDVAGDRIVAAAIFLVECRNPC